ncbi:hypothetical protein JB92DRAFT_2792396 [Gautieria morchelliformis]|nr:hypothetical protein JB92DRAFT_2792396 [Gautieria morchelliformis]
MTTGYAFRIENQATVSYLQKVGKPSCLVNVQVVQYDSKSSVVGWLRDLLLTEDIAASLLYLLGVALTIVVVALLGAIRDFWAIGVLLLLMLARLLNVVVIKRRSMPGWKGAEEKGPPGDLLVTLSQDRWVRMRGLVDDLKAVTAGQWLRDETTVEGFATGFATLLVYVSAAVASNASTVGNLLIGCLLLISVALLGLCNSLTKNLRMFNRVVFTTGGPTQYTRRLDLAEEMIRASGREDWAIAMGLILSPVNSAQKTL